MDLRRQKTSKLVGSLSLVLTEKLTF